MARNRWWSWWGILLLKATGLLILNEQRSQTKKENYAFPGCECFNVQRGKCWCGCTLFRHNRGLDRTQLSYPPGWFHLNQPKLQTALKPNCSYKYVFVRQCNCSRMIFSINLIRICLSTLIKDKYIKWQQQILSTKITNIGHIDFFLPKYQIFQ